MLLLLCPHKVRITLSQQSKTLRHHCVYHIAKCTLRVMYFISCHYCTVQYTRMFCMYSDTHILASLEKSMNELFSLKLLYVLIPLGKRRCQWTAAESVSMREVVAQKTQRTRPMRNAVLQLRRHLGERQLFVGRSARREFGNERRVPAECARAARRYQTSVDAPNEQTHAKQLPRGRVGRGALLVQNRRYFRVHVAHWPACQE